MQEIVHSHVAKKSASLSDPDSGFSGDHIPTFRCISQIVSRAVLGRGPRNLHPHGACEYLAAQAVQETSTSEFRASIHMTVSSDRLIQKCIYSNKLPRMNICLPSFGIQDHVCSSPMYIPHGRGPAGVQVPAAYLLPTFLAQKAITTMPVKLGFVAAEP